MRGKSKVVLRGKVDLNSSIGNEKRSQISNPSSYFKTLEKKGKNKPTKDLKASRRKERINIITEIYEIESRDIISEAKS